MKEDIFDHVLRGVILAGLVLFGLRGVLPDLVAEGRLPDLFFAGAAVIAGYAIGLYTYRCEPRCDPELCRAA